MDRSSQPPFLAPGARMTWVQRNNSRLGFNLQHNFIARMIWIECDPGQSIWIASEIKWSNQNRWDFVPALWRSFDGIWQSSTVFWRTADGPLMDFRRTSDWLSIDFYCTFDGLWQTFDTLWIVFWRTVDRLLTVFWRSVTVLSGPIRSRRIGGNRQ